MQLNLSKQDIDYIARVAQTEVDHSLKRSNPEMYEKMTAGVVDTILNRIASPSFPNTVEGVVNQRRQFTKIAGPAKEKPYGSVQRTPKARASFQQEIENYIGARASGAPSSVGGNLHYANPYHSDKKNRVWIDKLEGPKFGQNRSIHHHGTTEGFKPVGEFSLSVEGGASPVPLNDAALMNLEFNSTGLPEANAPIPSGLFGATPKSNGLGLANLVDGNRNKSAVQYANQSKDRNQRLSPATEARMSQAVAAVGKKHGVEIKPIVASGGQFSKIDLTSGTLKGKRAGGPRHDHGGAGDFDFEVNGRLLSMAKPNDRQILTDIIEENVALGNVGIGYAPKYMGLNRLHIGGGKPASWGAKVNNVRQPAPKFVQDAHARGLSRYDPSKPLYVDVPTPQQQTSAAPFGQVQRQELGPASITPAPFGQVQRENLGPASNINPLNNRPILNNGDGTYSTEETITVTHPSMNGGKPTNVPSIWGGQRYDNEDEIVDRAIKSGQTFQSYESIPAAVSAAKERSNRLAQGLKPRPAPVDFSTSLYPTGKPKASDYSNYQMMKKHSALPLGMAAPKPVPRPTDIPKAYTPKASDYSNYMMNVKQPTLPTGSAIPTPAARPADLTPAIQGPVGQPLELVPTPPTRIQQAKTKATNHLKEQLHPKTLAARGAGALIGGLLGGPMGSRAGMMLGPKIAKHLNSNKQPGLFGMFNNNNVPIPTNRNMSSSSSTWGNAQNQGATYIASDGATITGRGNGTYSRTNPITGKSSQWNEDGSRSTKGY
jgi:gas vesicle protein